MKELQKLVDDKFREHFGYTPLGERLKDIQSEFFELMKWNDIKNLKEETGDLLASLIKLCAESGWDAEELVLKTLKKIDKRADQYKTLGRKTKVAILGGAFNPIHIGHIQLAQFVLNTSGQFDEVWLMPAYKHMYNKAMVDCKHRLAMCEIAAKVDSRIKVFDYEIRNQLKGETYYFFKKLKEETELTEKYQFSMIMGIDNANTFDKWVNYKELENIAKFVVVSRAGVKRDTNVDWYLHHPHIFLDAKKSILDISSSVIRNMLDSTQMTSQGFRNSRDVDILKYLNPGVLDYIKEHDLY